MENATIDTNSELAEQMIAENEAYRESIHAAIRQEYIDGAKTVSYNNLIREPYNYEGLVIQVKIKVSQVMSGGVLTESGYRGYESGADNEWYITYEIPDGVPRIIDNDTVTFYGTYAGITTMTRGLTGTKVEVPRLIAVYHK